MNLDKLYNIEILYIDDLTQYGIIGSYAPSLNRIYLDSKRSTNLTLLHELAHHIDCKLSNNRLENEILTDLLAFMLAVYHGIELSESDLIDDHFDFDEVEYLQLYNNFKERRE